MSVSISDVNAAIAAMVSAGVEVDYTIGDKSFKNSQKLKQLLELRKQLMENPEVDISILDFDFAITEFGKNISEYL